MVYPGAGRFKQKLKAFFWAFRQLFLLGKTTRPYGQDVSDVRDVALHLCALTAQVTGSKSISDISVCRAGKPSDCFSDGDRYYSMIFIEMFRRYCFVNRAVKFNGDEVIVELGTGSGHQVEVLKKLYPNLTVLCFDLPAQLYVCEKYLTDALGHECIVSSEKGVLWNDLSQLEKGKVHFFGNWQMPLLQGFNFDVFWNAASFGEMEPEVVANYLSFVRGARYSYLLQATHGKERHRVTKPINFSDYDGWLIGCERIQTDQPWRGFQKVKQSKGYTHAVWKR